MTTTPTEHLNIIHDNAQCLEQGVVLLRELSDEQFTQSTPLAEGTIGSHFRHNLEHYTCLIQQWESQHVNYDHRSRNNELEEFTESAIACTQNISKALLDLNYEAITKPLTIHADTGLNDKSLSESHSTLHRELLFLASHTIHHYALIAMLCRYMAIDVPHYFGVAPSTLRYRIS